MHKLLAAYAAKPTLQNANRLHAYAQKHPMAVCMLTTDDLGLLMRATAHATGFAQF